MASIDKFKSSFSDFLRPNIYALYIFPKTAFTTDIIDNNRIGMLCHEATFPFYTFNTNSYWYNNKKTSFVDNIDYDPVSFSFYVDRDNIILSFFEAWRKQIIDDDHKIGFYDDYVSVVEIELFDRQLQTTAIASLVDAFPVNVESFNLGYAQNDSILELKVTFQFKEISYNFLKAPEQKRIDSTSSTKSWKDFLTLGNLRRGVNMVSKIKNYRRMIENGNPYDIITNARKVFAISNNASKGYNIVDKASRIF